MQTTEKKQKQVWDNFKKFSKKSGFKSCYIFAMHEDGLIFETVENMGVGNLLLFRELITIRIDKLLRMIPNSRRGV